jgi:Ca-activated chloride channel family protein
MKKNIVGFIILVFTLSFSSFGQVVFEKTKHDFGDIQAYDDRFVDIVVTNKGEKQAYLLSVKKPLDVVYLVNGQFMEKDSSLIIRLQPNPKSTGRFSSEVQIYTSDKDKPTIIKLTGNLIALPKNNLSSFQACPDFRARPGGKNALNFDLTVVTIDTETKELLSKSSVTLIQNGQAIGQYDTDKNGTFTEDITLGFTYFYATHTNYLPSEKGAYVNSQRREVVIELTKSPIKEEPIAITVPEVVVPKVETEEKPVKEISIVLVEKKLEVALEKEQVTTPTLVAEIPLKLKELDKNNFDERYFKPVNVVFVLDVSGSMNAGEKMELMKYSLNSLAGMLRPADKMGIVTYATNTYIMLPPTSGADKETILAKVNKLNASGATAGGAGIKLGYKQVLKNASVIQANQIIIITDGAFNRNSDDYKKYIKRYKKKGINLSVVGIQNHMKDEEEMKNAAALGGGRYIPIFKLVDAQNNLKQEIRLISFRH